VPTDPEPESARVTVSIESGVADVRLNRPEKLNAVDPDMFDAVVAAAQRVGADPSVRAVVLSGEGRAFCAGLDFSSFQAMAGPERRAEARAGAPRPLDRPEGSIANRGQLAAFAWTEMAVPVIAAVHGVALGAGFQIALGADIRIVAPDARLSVLEIRWGLTPDMTGTYMLPRLVPLDVAKELTWTGRMVFGEEAVVLGLATRVSDDPRRDALALAADLAAGNPYAIRGAKRLLNQSGQVSQEQQFRDESTTIASLVGTPNQVEAVKAYFEKRPPVFADPV
jgi:enoyl-CoA hydratase/carnithine racemase